MHYKTRPHSDNHYNHIDSMRSLLQAFVRAELNLIAEHSSDIGGDVAKLKAWFDWYCKAYELTPPAIDWSPYILIDYTLADTTPEVLADRMKAEIVQHVLSGRVPATVSTFSQLHDYLDANLLGGTEQILDAMHTVRADSLDGHRGAMDALCTLANAAQEIVEKWLRDGGLIKVVARPS